MELKVFNRELDLLGIIDSFTSLRWVRRYDKTGEFELHCPLTTETLQLLKREHLIYKGGREAAYIIHRTLGLDNEGAETLVVKGFFLTNYLNRRINWGRFMATATAESVMRRLVNEHAINPSDSKRKIPFLSLGQLKGLTDRIDYQNSYGNVTECLESIAKSVEYGFGVFVDFETKTLVFEVYQGENRSVHQRLNPPCIFSRDYENIHTQTYVDSSDNYRNTCLIGGAGENEARKLTEILQGNGLDRYELFVDARDLSDTDEADEEIPWEQYEALLLQRGNEKLADYQEITTFDSKINVRGNLIYQQDYELGDIITCHDPKWGITMDTRITEVEEVYESHKMEINVTFGTNIPTFIDKLKARMR